MKNTEIQPSVAFASEGKLVKKRKDQIMMNESSKCDKHIKGINCSVKNCVYHDGECYCTAENIHVGPHHAEKSADTVCATFKPECANGGCSIK